MSNCNKLSKYFQEWLYFVFSEVIFEFQSFCYIEVMFEFQSFCYIDIIIDPCAVVRNNTDRSACLTSLPYHSLEVGIDITHPYSYFNNFICTHLCIFVFGSMKYWLCVTFCKQHCSRETEQSHHKDHLGCLVVATVISFPSLLSPSWQPLSCSLFL